MKESYLQELCEMYQKLETKLQQVHFVSQHIIIPENSKVCAKHYQAITHPS
jgi:hypothetical protein